LPLAYLLGAVATFGAAYHHWRHDFYAADDIGEFAAAAAEPRPAHLRGIILQEPAVVRQPADDPLRSMPRSDPTIGVLQVNGYRGEDAWLPVSGRARLIVEAPLENIHVGDEVEVTGRLVAPPGPANPGEPDEAALLRDQRIRAVVLVRKTADAVIPVARGWTTSLAGWLAVLRGWGQRQLTDSLSPETSGLAMALLLGEGSTLTHNDWDKYKRTGVVHVLIIAGYHLVILAGFLWFGLKVLGVRRRRGAIIVALLIIGYALLTGGRPPVMRSMVTVVAACGALVLCRPVLAANSFALAWLVVAVLNPGDLCTAGCELSFLTVALLYWGAGRWFDSRPDPLGRLEDEARPAWQRNLRALLRRIAAAYAITLVLWLVAAPLVAYRYHTVSPIGIVLLPPLMLVVSVALISGFLLLLAAALAPFLVPLFARITELCLAGCDRAVTFSDGLPGSHWYVGDIPTWWLWVFYLGLLGALMLEPLRRRWRWGLTAGLGWLCVGLVSGSAPAPGEFRCTFLAVGHGGCTVIEAPDGRTLLYDAGTMTGPEVTSRHIAPFLWHQGVRRLDEVFVSHADLDHFNGLPALLDRFAVGQISCTPTFADRNTPGVRNALEAIERYRVPMRIVRAGDRLTAGDVAIEVLHPPAVGPEGKENHRSLVLKIRYRSRSILLTGDLEGPGLSRVLELPREPVDVLMAPHHGSKTSNTPGLAEWAQPRVVVSCEGPPRAPTRPAEPYSPRKARFFGTWPHGAVTVRSDGDRFFVETFRTKKSVPLDD
jgi:competence protein ComEC